MIEYLSTKELNFRATLDPKEAFARADFIIISTPTNYDPDKNFFDTSSVETVIGEVFMNDFTGFIELHRQERVNTTAEIAAFMKGYKGTGFIF